MIVPRPTEGDEMRPSDQIKATRSYVLHREQNGELKIKPSHWAPGYTPGHQPTPDEAIDFAIEQAELEMNQAQAKVVELHDLKASLLAGVE